MRRATPTIDEARELVNSLPSMPTAVSRRYGQWQFGGEDITLEPTIDWLCEVEEKFMEEQYPGTHDGWDDFWTAMEERFTVCATCEGSGDKNTYTDGGRAVTTTDCPDCNGRGLEDCND